MSRARSLVFAGVAMFAAPAFAGDGYDGQTRTPVHDGSGTFTAWGVDPLERGAFHGGLWFDHARDPVVLQAGGDFVVPVVSQANVAELGAFYGLPFNLEAGLVVPFASRTVPNAFGTDGEGGIPSSGLGDVRAEAKWRILAPHGVLPGVALGAGASLPTGDGRAWLGAGVAQPHLTAIVEERVGPIRLLGNIGYRMRSTSEDSHWGIRTGDALLLRAGAAWDTGLSDLSLTADAAGLATAGGGPSPMEAGLGVRKGLPGGLSASAGFSVGLNDSIGTPAWRAVAGVHWSFGKDATPADPAVGRVPVVASAGSAPNPGGANPEDAKPDSPKAPSGSAVAAPGNGTAPTGSSGVAALAAAPAATAPQGPGAPPPAGTPQALARARLAARAGLNAYQKGDYAEARTKFAEALVSEAWLQVPERVLLQKYVGFTEVAFDRRDAAKAAFKRALQYDANFSLAGARVSPKIVQVFEEARAEFKQEQAPLAIRTGLATLENDRIRVARPIEFVGRSKTLTPDSTAVLDEVAALLRKHPEVMLLRIEVHAGPSGNASADLKLTQERAMALAAQLVRAGVPQKQLSARGYGSQAKAARDRIDLRVFRKR